MYYKDIPVIENQPKSGEVEEVIRDEEILIEMRLNTNN
jgi:hypothetical protein